MDRLDQAKREMERMFGEDRKMPGTSDRLGFYINLYFLFNKQLNCTCRVVKGLLGFNIYLRHN